MNARVVDSSAWIEGFIRGLPNSRVVKLLPVRENWIVPTIVQYELAKWLQREADAEFAAAVFAYMARCQIVELTSSIALAAADYSKAYKLPTADAVIYATAMDQDADVLTCDAHFENLPRVLYLPKHSS